MTPSTLKYQDDPEIEDTDDLDEDTYDCELCFDEKSLYSIPDKKYFPCECALPK